MGFRELEKEFKEQVGAGHTVAASRDSSPDVQLAAETTYRYWLLRLLFEIAGNLDSLVVSYRELVKLNKMKADNQNFNAKLKEGAK